MTIPTRRRCFFLIDLVAEPKMGSPSPIGEALQCVPERAQDGRYQRADADPSLCFGTATGLDAPSLLHCNKETSTHRSIIDRTYGGYRWPWLVALPITA